MQKIFCLLFLVITFHIAQAQKLQKRFITASDVIHDSTKIKTTGCGDYRNYIPDTLHPEYTPVRYVRVNVHVMQDGNGGHNFSEAEGRAWVKQLVADANQRLQQNCKMNLPAGNTTPVLDVPIHYVLTGRPGHPEDDGIYFHRDDSLFYMNKKGDGKTNVYSKRQFDKYGIQKDTVINIFMMEHPPDSIRSATYKSSNDGVGMGTWVKLVGFYYTYKHPTVIAPGDTGKFTTWEGAGLFNHELGHCFGLSHTWSFDDGCDDTPKNPGCWNYGAPPCDVVSNNVMDYNAYQCAYTPCQIGKMCKNFFDEKNQRRFLIPDWCTYQPDKSITIASGEQIVWDRSMDVSGDLIVENNATLTIRCIVNMPPEGKIILKPKALLNIENGTVTCRCPDGKKWAGIEAWSKKNCNPQLHINLKGKIENVEHEL